MTCVLFSLDQSSHTCTCTLMHANNAHSLAFSSQNDQFSQDDNSSHVSENVNKIL